ncbi:peptidoglycan DD-metalloendopeptidase family protein [Aggregatimonas sangjinii]|nr:peptidoglycan DD-metalloendopeptidase family protein [Aggregatimonas sangjinii]
METIPILDADIPFTAYTRLDLSDGNIDLAAYDITDPLECQTYIDTVLEQNNGQVAYGGYLEKRNLYSDKVGFSGKSARNIHLGVDFWSKAGTKVLVPLAGKVHSLQNNATQGDYGPTIILEHEIENTVFYSLYGHLSLASLEGLSIGKVFKKGETLATLGTPDINVNYAPHLHFQLIRDIEGKKGDYPGVCSINRMAFYKNNCPNPSFLLNI